MCDRYYGFLSDESLLTRFYKNGDRLIEVSAKVLTYLLCEQYSHNAWFLDGRTSTLVHKALTE